MTIQDGNAGTGIGGGINSLESTLTITRCSFLNNIANQGGSISIDGGSKAGKLTITASTISGDTATQGRGCLPPTQKPPSPAAQSAATRRQRFRRPAARARSIPRASI